MSSLYIYVVRFQKRVDYGQYTLSVVTIAYQGAKQIRVGKSLSKTVSISFHLFKIVSYRNFYRRFVSSFFKKT